MRRRVIAAILAAILAIVAVALVAAYVVRADQRALAQFDPAPVLVVTAEIPAGGQLLLGKNAEVRELPAAAVVPGALTTPEGASDLVAAGPLVPGEQVTPNRLTTREALTGDQAEVPAELVQVTVLLAPERVLGGTLSAGDTVGVVVSVQPDVGPYWSETILHRVLVSRIQEAQEAPEATQETKEGTKVTQPPGSQFITLALAAPDAERVVWGAEHGTLWLTLEREGSVTDGTERVDVGNVWTNPGSAQS